MNPEIHTGEKIEGDKQEMPYASVGEKVSKFLRRTKFLELKGNEEEFEQWLQSVDSQEFSDLLVRLNGIIREIPINEREVDGEKVIVSFGNVGDEVSYLPPLASDKLDLLNKTLESIKQLSSNTDRGMLLYYALQAVHPFVDGNGRTGRLLYTLFAGGGGGVSEEQLKELLDHNEQSAQGTGKGREEFANTVVSPDRAYPLFTRELAKQMFGNQFIDEIGKIYYTGQSGAVENLRKDIDITPEEYALLQSILSESEGGNFSFRSLAVMKLLNDNGKRDQYVSDMQRKTQEKEVFTEDVGKRLVVIDHSKFGSEISADDARKLIEIYGSIKRDFVGVIADTFLHPEQHVLRAKDGSEHLIKDILDRRSA